MTGQVLRVAVRGGVATLTLDSPANRNALSRAMRAELRAALTAALADAVRVVVLDHSGPVFCSGMDLTEAAGGAAEDQGVNEFPALLEMVRDAPKPVVVLPRMLDLSARFFASDEGQEGMAAFREKRPARWVPA